LLSLSLAFPEPPHRVQNGRCSRGWGTAPREKSRAGSEKQSENGGPVRALRAEFVRKPRTKRFCSERCQRIAERRRYRERHTEKAICPNCETVFERTATSMRKAIFCSPSCMAEHRSASYAKRPDIQAGIRRAREATGNPA
jgi:hypothetical protein